MNKRTTERMHGWIDGLTKGWTRWIDEWTDGWVIE